MGTAGHLEEAVDVQSWDANPTLRRRRGRSVSREWRDPEGLAQVWLSPTGTLELA